LRKTFRKLNKPRDDSGRYAPKDGKPALKDNAPNLAEGQTDDQKPSAEGKPEQPKAPAIPAPQSWSADAKAKWAQLPPDVQQIVARREVEAHTAISELGAKAKAYDSVHEVIAPHMDRIRQANEHPATYVRNLFVADQMLERDAVGFIKYIAQQKGIDLASLSDPFAQQDPQTSQWEARNHALQAEIVALKQQLDQIGHKVIGREQAEQQSQLNHYVKMINDFAATKADWSEIGAQTMAFSIRQVQADNPDLPPQDVIQQAYDRARWANPATRQKLLAEQQAEAEAKRLDAAKKAASQARRAGAINVNGSTMPAAARASLDDDLRAIWRRNHAN
ncbi:MAG: hypothetical protein EBT27_09860, partial [Betaproteobacteria bacterium]|nr:hypothetical protein [Betaproteobacteria bacterium]